MGTIDGYRIRRLTPLECFRLQGFPDEMVKVARDIGLSDTHLYKMAGNAVTVNVIEAVARKLAEVVYGTT
jgi:DNA (cytosine-5)-methyltransferase 1